MTRTALLVGVISALMSLPACGPKFRVEVTNEVGEPIAVEVIEKWLVYDRSQTINHQYRPTGERTVQRLRSDLAIGGQLVATAKLDDEPQTPWYLVISSPAYQPVEVPIEGNKLPLRVSVRQQEGSLMVVPFER